MEDMLLWCDLETAGTDERMDPILEIACVVTEMNPELTELAAYESPLYPRGQGWDLEMIRKAADPHVRNMHEDSGLWAAVADHGKAAWEAQGELISVLGDLGKPHRFVLAGSGVSHFDRRFIKSQLPELDRWLKYYCIDVGVLRRTLAIMGHSELVGSASGKDKPHRAMADVRLHIQELRQMGSRLSALHRIATESAGRFLLER